MKRNQVVTNPSPSNLDLNVRVRALVGINYTAFGAACRARVNGSVGSAVVDGASYHSQLLGDQASLALTLYPNPNRDGQVNLVLVGMGDATEWVTVDVYDMFGKRVHTEQVEASGEEFTHQMNLDLATGMYMVNLTIEGQVITQRLIKQ